MTHLQISVVLLCSSLVEIILMIKHIYFILKDLDTRAKTKEEFMFKRCQERIRNYMYKTKTDMMKSDFYINNSNCRRFLDEVYKKFNELLNKNKYHGYYFDRSNSYCLCDNIGMFTCQGAWNQTGCFYERGTGHKINPYQNRECRIIFSTWNLDHWYSIEYYLLNRNKSFKCFNCF